MKILDSYFFNLINSGLAFIQSKTGIIKQNSYIISHLDILILFFIISLYIVSVFAQTNLIGCISFFIPILVVINVILTSGEKIELEKCNIYIIIYLLICLISNLTSTMPAQSFYGFSKTLMYIGFYFALCQFLKNNKKYIVILLSVIAILVSFESFIGIIQNTLRVENISTWQDVSYLNPEDVLSRVYGTLKPYNPNLLGGYLVCSISSILGIIAYMYNKKFYKFSILSAILFFISAFAIFLTGCRGAYLALFAIFIGIILASHQIIFNNYEKYKNMWKKLISICSIFCIGFMLFNQKIFQRLMSIFILRGDSSTSFRMNVYHSSIQMFQDNWLFGIGVGNKVFREIYGLYMLSGFDALSCYCIFLEMAVESGIFSLIAYLLFIISILKSGICTFIESKDIYFKVLLFVPIISIIAVMCHGLFDTIYFRPQVQYIFWTMAAILTVLTREQKREQ